MTKLKTLALAAFLFLPAACNSTETAASQPTSGGFVNTMCPIADEPIDPDVEGVMFRGYTVGFCCGGCKGDWNGWTDEQKAAFIAAAQKN